MATGLLIAVGVGIDELRVGDLATLPLRSAGADALPPRITTLRLIASPALCATVQGKVVIGIDVASNATADSSTDSGLVASDFSPSSFSSCSSSCDPDSSTDSGRVASDFSPSSPSSCSSSSCKTPAALRLTLRWLAFVSLGDLRIMLPAGRTSMLLLPSVAL
eukprot:CAMPEP_0180594612 /NCGR_PEP_ID=MMETSP1037_2-20121125/20867_1 /TAXON_ID=632150 /ORGANISM="Azadinium spinosum, Strain 3D9" /LENGTH=162 /DNA_ID=CAMNT_0022613051 /DNA_START=164 /DNA_END=653 /DNA_ORIENTATION=-